MKSLLSTKEKIEIWIFRFLNYFLKMWRIEARYKVERTGERADSWPTLMLTLKKKR